jgi:hypothetical protein
MKLFIFVALCLLIAFAFPAAAATSVASLNGIYNFSVRETSHAYGYWNQSTWVTVNGQCPKNVQCWVEAFDNVSVGTIQFDGKGNAKFLSFTTYCVGCGGGGPKVGTIYKYTVSGYNATLTIPGTNGASVALALGSFNAQNIATTALMLIIDSNSGVKDAMTGIANLQ